MYLSYETERLSLRVLRPEEAGLVLDFFNRDRAYFERFEADRVPNFYTLEFQKETVRNEYNLAIRCAYVRFYVFEKQHPDKIIGTMCFHNITYPIYGSCEVGYKFSTAYQHKGYAYEALEKGIDIMFSELKLHRIMAWVLPDNQPSIRLLKNLGFSYEGINRQRLYMHGVWEDHAQFSLLNPMG